MLGRESTIWHEWHDLMKMRMWRQKCELAREELLTAQPSEAHGWAGVQLVHRACTRKGPRPPLPPFYKSGMKATSVGGIHILDSAAKQNKPLVVSDNNGSYQLSGTWTLKGSKFPGKLSSAASPPPTTGMRSTSLVAGESSRVIHWKILIGLEMDQLFYCD